MKKKGLIIVMVILIIALIAGYFVIQSKNKAQQGAKTVTIIVVQEDGKKTEHVCHTDAENLEDLFAETDFVKGEQGPYGLYITEVDGVFAKYETTGTYWGMNKDGEALMTGAKDTLIADGETYELVYTKL